MIKKRIGQKGFTLVELMIATLVFSLLLLIIMAAVVQITRSYYKGVNNTRTQEVGRNIMGTISEAIQFSGGNIATGLVNDTSSGFCVDHYRFSYITAPDHFYTGAANDHGLVMDDIGGADCSSASGQPQLLDGLAREPDGPVKGKELLLPRMRVIELKVERIDVTDLYRITVRLGLGENDLLSGGRCLGIRGNEYCSVTTLTNIVQKRVQ